MSELRQKALSHALFPAVLLGASLAGCGGGGGGDPVAPPVVAVNTVSGVASKGPLSGASLCAYAITNGSKGAPIGSCVQSPATGAYTLDLGTYTGPVLLEATGGSYVDEATGTTLTLATPLRSVLPNFTGGSTSAAVTALTELAYQLAAASTGGLTAANAQSAQATVQSNFGVADILATQPVDALSLPAGATADQKAYALALATVSQYLQAQPAGATLAGALQTIDACLAGGGCGTLGSDLAAALGSFQGTHAGYAGLSLPATAFGGTAGGLGCNTAHYQAGAVRQPTATELASFAKTYAGNTGSFDSGSWASNGGAASFVLGNTGALTYNGAAQTVNSLCADTGIAMLYVEFGGTGEVDLFADGTFTGNLPDLTSVHSASSAAATPEVASYAPTSGAVGATVTISGSNLGNFNPAPLVKFGTTTATVSQATATAITVTVPAGLAAGSTAITLSNFDGSGAIPVGNFSVSAATGGGATGTTCLIDGATAALPNAKVCFASLPVPFTCDATGMHKTAAGYLASSGAPSYTYTLVDSCPANVLAGLATAFTTTSGSSTASTLAGAAIAPTTFAGPEVDGPAASARFYFGSTSTYNGSGLTSDGSALYVVDAGHLAIRKVDLTSGAVITIAGNAAGVDHPTGFPAGFGDGVGTAAYFNGPHGITMDSGHTTLYVADSRYVRKIDMATSTVSTLAYVAPKTSATFKNVTTNATDWFRGATDVATDGVTLYVLDVDIDTGASGGMRLLALDLASNQVRNVAVALPKRSQSLLLDGNTLYVAGGGYVSKIDLATSTLTALAGGDSTVSRDGVGSAARFSLRNEGLATDGSHLYISDGTLVRQLELATGVVTTLAGDTAGYADGVGDAAHFKLLGGMVRVDGALYLTDNLSAIRKLVP